jgi:protein phosphatase
MRYPELEFVSVPAKRTYCEPARPFLFNADSVTSLSDQHLCDDILDIDDLFGKRIISTRLQRNITIREENATAALEVMTRFAANPKWLIYLPPTMAPCETSTEEGLLEHPAQAFDYYRDQCIPTVICEEKHMGSRAVIVICKDERVARERFGVIENELGIIYTRTGRRFFNETAVEVGILDRLREAMTSSGFWDQLNTSWACFDCELMPWSAKAQDLLRTQYAAVGSAGVASLPPAIDAMKLAHNRLSSERGLANTLQSFSNRFASINQFITAYRQYCWPVTCVEDLKVAPFHLMATEGNVHHDKNHLWHMEALANICRQDSQLFLATNYLTVDLSDADSIRNGIEWWRRLTNNGGEGMVVKPMDWIMRGEKGMVQPAVKCRGKEYLRIIYGADYDSCENLTRLRRRGLGRKQSLANREFALGVESLERFIRREPLRHVHECVFGVLALESEPVDPRL